MKKIGITGGIGSGKSIISKIFALLGVPCYNADARARYLMDNLPILRTEIEKLLGADAYTSDNRVNRAFVAKQVFADKQKLSQLNNLVHPEVANDFSEWCLQWQYVPYVLKEAALLYESGSHTMLDHTILVSAPESIRIRRVLQRDPHRSVEDVNRIIKQQMEEKDQIPMATWVIVNDDNELVVPQVLDIHTMLT